jgi:DNA-binding Lrp family transcriptional regulator
MNALFTPIEFRLLNDWQRGFPLSPAPFASLARELGTDEATVLDGLQRMHAAGVVSRVGAVFAPQRVGASTLAALRVPATRIDEVAAMVTARPEVNHNYEREHAYNLWFVATASDEGRLAATLAEIETATACPLISLPLVEEFHIDLGFDLAGGSKTRISRATGTLRAPDEAERRLIAALQPGLDLVPRPFARLAMKAGMTESEVLARISEWLDAGLLKRFGVVVRHRELGYTANAMVVFDVPDAAVSTVGARLAGEPGVTLCYRRRRQLPEWSANLFCMVHGRSREEVEPIVERLCRTAGYHCDVLFSTRRFKQRGARYFDAPILDAA